MVDATANALEDAGVTGGFSLDGLHARVRAAVGRVGAVRVALDSVAALFPRYAEAPVVRLELRRLVAALKEMGVTPLLTVDRESEDGAVTRHGVEEFVTDSVVVLRNRLENEKRRRTVELLKFRGADHATGEYPLTISGEVGIGTLPLTAFSLDHDASEERVSTGVSRLDALCGGGLFRGSVTLVSGATGTGKTILVTHFLANALQTGERAMLFGFEESRAQLLRNARAMALDLEGAEQAGLVRIVARYPESMGMEEHLAAVKRAIAEFGPQRVAVDSLTALQRLSDAKPFREFVLGVCGHLKQLGCTGLITNTAHVVAGVPSVTEAHISSITDTIILLRYVELEGIMHRGINVLKMRGSGHEKRFMEYGVSEGGLCIGEPFKHVTGILAGAPSLI